MFAVLPLLLIISTVSGWGKIAQYTVDLSKLEHEPYLSLHTAIDDNLVELCAALQQWDPNDKGSYDAIKAIGAKITNKYGYRTTLCVPDGSVIYDAPKGADNTFENAVNKAIDENHNTRVSIMSAQLNDEGKAWEEKLSTSSSTVENYVSERCGNQFENFGTVRLSAVAQNNGGSDECTKHNDCEKKYRCYHGTCIHKKDYKNKRRLLLGKVDGRRILLGKEQERRLLLGKGEEEHDRGLLLGKGEVTRPRRLLLGKEGRRLLLGKTGTIHARRLLLGKGQTDTVHDRRLLLGKENKGRLLLGKEQTEE
eukprot:626100_1